jgi:hypothetical protein
MWSFIARSLEIATILLIAAIALVVWGKSEQEQVLINPWIASALRFNPMKKVRMVNFPSRENSKISI